MMQSLKRINDRIEKGILFVCAALFYAMFVCCVTQVVSRFVFRHALPWTEEYARFLMCYVVMLGSVVLLRHGGHVAMTFVTSRLKQRNMKLISDLLVLAVIMFFLYYMIRYGYVAMLSAVKQFTTVMHVNYGLIYACVPFAGILMVWYSIELICEAFYRFVKGSDAKETFSKETGGND